jgi:chromatin segregation and condensation protein Rec8/ScpA/Scc1 (kleisin family)
MSSWALAILLAAPPTDTSTVGGALEAAAVAMSAKRWHDVETYALTALRLDSGNPDAVELIFRAHAQAPADPVATPARLRLEPRLPGALEETRALWRRRLKEATRAGRLESVQHGRIREMMLSVVEESPP